MRDYYLLSEVYNIAYHGAWWYSELRLNKTAPIPALSPLYIPYIVLLIPDSDRRLSHNVSVSSELILKYFGWRSDDLRPQ